MSDAANCMHRQFTESQSYCPDCGLSRSEVLVAACEPYLKDDETPAECIARNRRDVDGCLTMLVAEKRKTEALQARLAEAEALLRVMPGYGLSAYDKERWEKARNAFLAPDSASDRDCIKRGGSHVPSHHPDDPYRCVLCGADTRTDQPEDAGNGR